MASVRFLLLVVLARAELLCRKSSKNGRRPPGGWSAARCLKQRGVSGEHCSWRVASRSPAQWAVAATLEGHADAICAISWSPDQQRILTASADGTAVIWAEQDKNYSAIENLDEDAWTSVAVLGASHHALVRDAVWSPDGARVLTGNADGIARVWEAARNVSHGTFEIPTNVSSPNGTSIAQVVGQQGPDRENWKVVAMLLNQPDPVISVDWKSSSSTGRVLTGLPDRTACLKESPSAKEAAGASWASLVSCTMENDLTDQRAHGDTHLVSGFARSGTIWSANRDLPIRWGMEATLEAEMHKPGHDKGDPATASSHLVAAVRWSPDGNRLLTGGNDGVARIWELFPKDFHGSGRRYWDVLTWTQAHTEAVWTVAWAPDGQRVLTGGRDGFAHIWSPFAGPGSDWVLEASLTPTNGIKIDPALQNTAPHSPHRYPRLDSLDRDANMGWVSGWAPAWVAAWSPDGHRILTGSRDGSARIWIENTSLADGWSLEATLIGHRAEIWSLAWSPDSFEVLTADQTGMARLWRCGNKTAAEEMTNSTSNVSDEIEMAINASNASNISEELFDNISSVPVDSDNDSVT